MLVSLLNAQPVKIKHIQTEENNKVIAFFIFFLIFQVNLIVNSKFGSANFKFFNFYVGHKITMLK